MLPCPAYCILGILVNMIDSLRPCKSVLDRIEENKFSFYNNMFHDKVHKYKIQYRGLKSNMEKNKYFSSRYIRSAHYKDLLETAKKKTAKTFAMPKLSASKL